MPPEYRFTQVANGPVKLYLPPEPGVRYTIGVDTATGVSTDWTVFSVLDNRLPFQQAAVWRAKRPIAKAAGELVDLALYYNKAFLVVETNGPGAGMMDAIITTHGYGNCYRPEEKLDSDPKISDKYGWATTQTSKWLLIRETQDALAHDEIILHDRQTLEELCNYIYIEDRSKTGAAQGLNDDTVIATMLAFHGAKLNPQRRAVATKDVLTTDQKQQRKMLAEFMAGLKRDAAGEGEIARI